MQHREPQHHELQHGPGREARAAAADGEGGTTSPVPPVGPPRSHSDTYLGHGPVSDGLRSAVTLAARLLLYPAAQLNILDEKSQHTLVAVGALAEGPTRVVPREQSFCDTVVRTGRPWAFADARREPGLTAHHAAFLERGVTSYVGVPLTGREGTTVGTLCLLDDAPHTTTTGDVALLRAAAQSVEEHLDLRRRRAEAAADGDRPAGLPAPGTLRAADTPGGRSDVQRTVDLARGIAAGEVEPWYEPVVDLRTGRVEGYEALARWRHPRLGVLAPAAFIPLAEDSDVILDLDLAVLHAAALAVTRWRRRDPRLRVTVNLSGRHLSHPECVQRIRDAVDSAGADPRSVGLELTETALAAPTAKSRLVVEDLRAAGFPILLDDFGTGGASMLQLLHLQVDTLKVDQCFTAASATGTGRALVRTFADLAARLGLDSVIEGVTTADQARRALELGFDCAQGRLYGEPRPAAGLPTG